GIVVQQSGQQVHRLRVTVGASTQGLAIDGQRTPHTLAVLLGPLSDDAVKGRRIERSQHAPYGAFTGWGWAVVAKASHLLGAQVHGPFDNGPNRGRTAEHRTGSDRQDALQR